MPTVLLRPYVLSIKNRIASQAKDGLLNRDFLVLVISILFVVGVYVATVSTLEKIQGHPDYTPLIAARMLHMCLFAFFVLLLLSSCVAALGYLFISKDLPIFLSAPVSRYRIYTSRLLAITANASWMFLFFGTPALIAFGVALDLPRAFYITVALASIPFILLPSIIGTIAITLFVNIIPPHRLKEILVVLAFALVCAILFLSNRSPAPLQNEAQQVENLIHFLDATALPDPAWSPSRWFYEIIIPFVADYRTEARKAAVYLFGSTALLFIFGACLYDKLFMRGWGMVIKGEKKQKGYSSSMSNLLAKLLFPFDSQLRALCLKEARMFVRDTTQSLQMLMLLMLTFVYLYNFRTLRAGPHVNAETYAWWHVILSVANIAFGACVISAITTRFVFPSISLEGRAYRLVRTAPLSIEQLLKHKFNTWIVPMSIVGLILLISGSLAIQVSLPSVVATAFIGLSLVAGIVGLGIGIGAVYAKFDWDSPAQVTAGFGSLVFMLLAVASIMVTTVPAILIFLLTSVPSFTLHMAKRDYLLLLGGLYFLVFMTNYVVARRALAAGAQHLKDLEV